MLGSVSLGAGTGVPSPAQATRWLLTHCGGHADIWWLLFRLAVPSQSPATVRVRAASVGQSPDRCNAIFLGDPEKHRSSSIILTKSFKKQRWAQKSM